MVSGASDSADAPPPLPPNSYHFQDLELEEPPIYATGQTFLYRIRNYPSHVYKGGCQQREYTMHLATGNCAIPLHQQVFTITKDKTWYFMGFTMDLARPLDLQLFD
jgi:hypothetical protein